MNDNYTSLANILDQAMNQASSGKGQERHASGEAFTEQPMFWIEKEFPSFQLGQAVKKIHESQRLEPEAAKRELLGAINYLAAHCIFLGTKEGFDKSYELTGVPIEEERKIPTASYGNVLIICPKCGMHGYLAHGDSEGICTVCAALKAYATVKGPAGEQLAPGVTFFDNEN